MRTVFNISAVAICFAFTPSPCFALWEIETVSKERAKELGLQIRATAAGGNLIQVQLDFKAEGELKNFSHVELRIGKGDSLELSTTLREERSKQGRIVVSFSADRAHLEKLSLWVMVPGTLGGAVYELRVKDLIDGQKVR